MRYRFLITIFTACSLQAFAQTGSIKEPVRYIGGVTADPSIHDGRLPWAIGVENRQVLRANRTHPEKTEDFGWTYNHAPDMAYWNGLFYLQYLSNPVDEHVAPGHTLLATSPDGRHWSKPKELFPPYKAPEGVKIPDGYNGYMMHQRMGFYVAPDGRLLAIAFYGHTEHPFAKGGIGRVVREIYKDGTWGPIYFIRYSSYANWNEKNTSYPFFTSSKDNGFVAACRALLADKLHAFQWLDEDSGNDDFYPNFKTYKDSVSALSFYHRKDGKVVALWKKSMTAISDDEGLHFSKPVKAPTLLMAGGKNWGQRTKDGRYAMVYNPVETQEYRFPLIIVTGDDGIIFDNMLLVHGEVPSRRFYGRWKDFGPNYTRGISEGNGVPPGNDMFVTYSVNKEDIWVSRIPLTVTHKVNTAVNDNFDGLPIDSAITNWNVYAPIWAPVQVAAFPNAKNKSLQLTDKDPYDYARAIRVFKEGTKVSVSMTVYPKQLDGYLDLEVTDHFGNRPVRIRFDEKGNLNAQDGDSMKVIRAYDKEQWIKLRMEISATPYGSYDLYVDDKPVLKNVQLAEAVKSVERLSFRTGPYRNLPNRKTPNQVEAAPLAGCDEPLAEKTFYIDNVIVK